MKTKLDLSMFSEKEIAFIKSDVYGIIKKDAPHYSRAKFYFYDIEKGEDIVVSFECSSPMIPYNIMASLKPMEEKGFILPYKTEWQRITDPVEISIIQERESLVEL
jgi:hypothetical protein